MGKLGLLGAALLLGSLPDARGDEMARLIREQERVFSGSLVWIKMVATDEGGNEETVLCSGPAVTHDGQALVVAPDVPTGLKSVRFLQPDGKELDAEVAARDADIGLMFVRAKVPSEAVVPAPGKMAKPPCLGDPLLLIDRRSHAAPDETTCRLVRVNGILSSPEPLTFYTGINSQQMGGLLVTPEGELVGVVGAFTDRDEHGKEHRGVAVLPMDKVLASLAAIQKPEPP